jgi:hypothetical protein
LLELSHISRIFAGNIDTSMMANMAAVLTSRVLTIESCIRKSLVLETCSHDWVLYPQITRPGDNHGFPYENLIT